MDNSIKLKKISELLGMKFFIPSYQRGYRWTEQQVKDLLNDINEFIPEKNKDSNEETWYCLQPLVVREMDENDSRLENETNKRDWYEVIDGQQRLTTVFLVIHYFNEMWVGKKKTPLFTIKYATRNDSSEFLKSLEINENNEAVVLGKKFPDYIDYHYMKLAYTTIHNWASNIGMSFNNNDFQSKFIHSTKVIWYESVGEDPIKVFTRLNIGKISLTNAELIKALFLNRSNFKTSDNNHLKLRQQEIASEWDNIEYTLQNDEFWLFLHKKNDYNRPTRIDSIFDIICEQNILKLHDEILKNIGNDEYKTFRYFYEHFKIDQIKFVLCWEKIKNYFQIFMEWYNDVQLYHYIGYLIEYDYTLSALTKEWDKSKGKKSFVDYVKSKVKKEIDMCPKLDFQYKDDGSDKYKCKPILLFHNIQTVINQNLINQNNEKYRLGVFYKFPFHLYRRENWEVEHINSNTTNDEDDDNTQKEWLSNVYLGTDISIQEKIQKYFASDDKNKKRVLFEEIKEHIPDVESWTPYEKNRIWNYALLDSSTNHSYGNTIFSGKRRIIIGKDKGKKIAIPKLNNDNQLILGKENEAKSSFVPPCTKQIFMKYYSSVMSNSNYWTKDDAQGYLNDIKECIKNLES